MKIEALNLDLDPKRLAAAAATTLACAISGPAIASAAPVEDSGFCHAQLAQTFHGSDISMGEVQSLNGPANGLAPTTVNQNGSHTPQADKDGGSQWCAK